MSFCRCYQFSLYISLLRSCVFSQKYPGYATNWTIGNLKFSIFRNGFVSADRVGDFRRFLDSGTDSETRVIDAQDPEVFLVLLFEKILRIPHLIRFRYWIFSCTKFENDLFKNVCISQLGALTSFSPTVGSNFVPNLSHFPKFLPEKC